MLSGFKAIIPAAGFGTRSLPATNSIPKELLPIVDTPSIQLIVEEALAAGIRDVVVVTSRGKHAIEDHFNISYEIEETLRKRGKLGLIEGLRRVADQVNLVSVRQKEPLGLGHAVLCAREVVGDSPIVVMLPDDLIDSTVPAAAQLGAVYEQRERGCVGLMEVAKGQESLYGIIGGRKVDGRLWAVDQLVEKPSSADAPSRMAVVARYVLPPSIFPILEQVEPGKGGEIQLTDGLAILARKEGLHGWELEGKRFDVGDKLGFLEANISYALKRPELAAPLREFLSKVLASCPS